MTAGNSKSLSTAVRNKLSEVRATLRKYVVLHSVLMIACWCLLLFWLGGVIDYMPVTFGSSETPTGFRLVLNWMMVLGSLAIVLFWTLPRLFFQVRDSSLALLVEKHHPQLNSRLVTAVELQSRATRLSTSSDDAVEPEISNPAAHELMLQRVHESLDRDVRDVEVGRLFNWQPVAAAAVSVVVSLLVTLLAIFVMPGWMSLWSQRLFALSDTPWPRRAELRLDGVEIQVPSFSGQLAAERTSLQFESGTVRLPRGSAALLSVSANAATKEVPEVCTLFYATDEGSRGRANMRRIGSPREGWQQFVLDGPPLDGLDTGLRLNIIGMDARLSDLSMQVVDPPLLSKLSLECEYPAYLNSLTRGETETRLYASGLRVPEGTRVVLLGETTTPLSRVEYVTKSVGAKLREATPTPESTPEESAVEPQAFEITQTQPLEENRRQFRIDLGRLESDQMVEIRVFDAYGLPADQVPRYAISVQADTAPEVASRLRGIGKAITPLAKLPLEASIKDDYAIKNVAAELVSGQDVSFEVALENPQEEELVADLDLQQLKEQNDFALNVGDTLALVVTATDYFDLDGVEQVGKGEPKTLAVVSEDQLLVLLDRQELEMRQRLEVIIREIEQLREALQTIVPGQTSQLSAKSRNSVVSQEAEDSDEDQSRLERMRILRAQQSVLQGDKSQQELLGVASGIQDLRLQLQNNRIDSRDRQARLQDKVHAPLVGLLDREYPRLTDDLLALRAAVKSGGRAEAQAAVRSVDDVLIKLLEIKENMLDIESFNEIIDLVRSLLEDQESLLKETEKAKRQKILDLLD